MLNKTIMDAVRDLQPDVRIAVIRAWNATGCMDLYGGELAQYIHVISCQLELRNRRVAALSDIIRSAAKVLS